MTLRTSRIWSGALALALAYTPVPFFGSSQAQAQGIEEITVTARRREESLQSVPLAVQSFGAELLDQSGINEISELEYIAPGLEVRPGIFRDTTPEFTIRGFNAGTGSFDSDPAIGLYFNEVPLNSAVGQNAAFFDLEAVQVLKGPQGTLFGRNSTGGAVLISSKKPILGEYGASAQVGIGNYKARNFDIVANIPVMDNLAIRAAFSRIKRDGTWVNVADGRDYDDKNSWAGRFSVLFEPTDNITNNTVFDYTEHDIHGSAIRFDAKGFDINDPSSYPANGTVFPCPIAPNAACAFHQNPIMLAPAFGVGGLGSLPAALEAEAAYQDSLGWGKFDSFVTAANSRFGVAPFEKIRNWGISNTTEIELNESITLKNIFGHRRSNVNLYEDIDGSSFGATLLSPFLGNSGLLDTEQAEALRQYTNEVQLLGESFEGALEWVVGGFYSRYKGSDNSDFAQFGSRAFNVFDIKAVSKSVFGEANWHVDDNLTLTGGLRYTWDDKDVVWRNHLGSLFDPTSGFFGSFGKDQVFAINGETFDLFDHDNDVNTDDEFLSNCNFNRSAAFGPGDTVDITDCSVRRGGDWKKLSYNVNVQYDFDDDTMAYVAHRQGYRAGFFSLRATDDASTTNNNEIVRDIEVGVKTDLDVGGIPVRMNVAGYQAWYSDIAVSISKIDTNTGLPISAAENSGKALLRGMEATVEALVTDDLKLSGNVAYTNGRYLSFPDQTVDGALGAPIIFYEGGGDPSFGDPSITYNAAASYSLPVDPAMGEVVFNVNYAHRAEARFDRKGFDTIAPYGIVNMSLNWYDVMGSGVDLGVWAKNLADKHYEDAQFNFEDAAGFRSVFPADPRTYGGRISYRFGTEAR